MTNVLSHSFPVTFNPSLSLSLFWCVTAVFFFFSLSLSVGGSAAAASAKVGILAPKGVSDTGGVGAQKWILGRLQRNLRCGRRCSCLCRGGNAAASQLGRISHAGKRRRLPLLLLLPLLLNMFVGMFFSTVVDLLLKVRFSLSCNRIKLHFIVLNSLSLFLSPVFLNHHPAPPTITDFHHLFHTYTNSLSRTATFFRVKHLIFCQSCSTSQSRSHSGFFLQR